MRFKFEKIAGGAVWFLHNGSERYISVHVSYEHVYSPIAGEYRIEVATYAKGKSECSKLFNFTAFEGDVVFGGLIEAYKAWAENHNKSNNELMEEIMHKLQHAEFELPVEPA